MSEQRQPNFDLAAALVDVRRAWRLVYAYQRRMNDLVAGVDTVLAHHGLEFELWQPLFNAPPTKRGTPYFRGRWAWDMLPGYATQVHWIDPQLKNGRRRRVVLQAVADSGRRFEGGEPDPVDFEPADAAETQLRLGLWTTTAAKPAWEAAWAVISTREYWLGVQSVDVEGAIYTYEYRAVDVADLVDASAAKALVLDMLSTWAAAA